MKFILDDDITTAEITLIAHKYSISPEDAIARLLGIALRIDKDMDVDGIEVQTHMKHGALRRWNWKSWMKGNAP